MRSQPSPSVATQHSSLCPLLTYILTRLLPAGRYAYIPVPLDQRQSSPLRLNCCLDSKGRFHGGLVEISSAVLFGTATKGEQRATKGDGKWPCLSGMGCDTVVSH